MSLNTTASIIFPVEIWLKIADLAVYVEEPISSEDYSNEYQSSIVTACSLRLVCKALRNVGLQAMYTTVHATSDIQFGLLSSSIIQDSRKIFSDRSIASHIKILSLDMKNTHKVWSGNVLANLERIIPLCSSLQQFRSNIVTTPSSDDSESAMYTIFDAFNSPNIQKCTISIKNGTEARIILYPSLRSCCAYLLKLGLKIRDLCIKRTSLSSIDVIVNDWNSSIIMQESYPINATRSSQYTQVHFVIDCRIPHSDFFDYSREVSTVHLLGLDSASPSDRSTAWRTATLHFDQLIIKERFPKFMFIYASTPSVKTAAQTIICQRWKEKCLGRVAYTEDIPNWIRLD